MYTFGLGVSTQTLLQSYNANKPREPHRSGSSEHAPGLVLRSGRGAKKTGLSFLLARRRIQPPIQPGVGSRSEVVSNGWFWPNPIPREEKLRRKKGQPRPENVFFEIAFPPGTFYGGSCGIALNSTTRMHPRLGLVAGSHGATQIHIRGLCHWAGEPAGHLGAESPSRGTAGPTSARKTSPPYPH